MKKNNYFKACVRNFLSNLYFLPNASPLETEKCIFYLKSSFHSQDIQIFIIFSLLFNPLQIQKDKLKWNNSWCLNKCLSTAFSLPKTEFLFDYLSEIDFSHSSMHPENYSETSQTTKIKLFVKTIKDILPPTYVVKNTILDVWQGYERVSAIRI